MMLYSTLTMLRLSLLLCVALPAVLGSQEPEKGKGQKWAVLAAGSHGYAYYRHQSDLCHAYQVLHQNGIPDSNIIVMMYDDIAYNSSNPTPGVILNRPGGPNVYKGVLKDYTGGTVTVKNFINVITGNDKAMEGIGSGKVLKSGPNDHVFINFVDCGGRGVIAFPDGRLYADDLIKALKKMHQNKMYKKLAFYMESSYAGSMFEDLLPKDINIVAVTASNSTQGSFATYWDDYRGTWLGDQYSVAWTEDIDSEEGHKNLTTETLFKQYNNILTRVNKSNPSIYGQKNLLKSHVKDYFGSKTKMSYDGEAASDVKKIPMEGVPGHDAVLHTLKMKLQLSNNDEEKEDIEKQLEYIIKGRKTVDNLFGRILARVPRMEATDRRTVEDSHLPLTMDMMPCYKSVVDSFSRTCLDVTKNPYILRQLYKLANLCAGQYSSPADMEQVFTAVCGSRLRALSGVH